MDNLFSSDGTVRKYATQQKIEVRGELWVLDEMVAGEHLTRAEAAEKLTQMIVQKARLPRHEVDKRMSAWTKLISSHDYETSDPAIRRTTLT